MDEERKPPAPADDLETLHGGDDADPLKPDTDIGVDLNTLHGGSEPKTIGVPKE